MKKIFIGLALGFATLSLAQQYPNNGWGNDDNYGYYDDQDDSNYFPDDYYYNYPQDYYPQDYYQNYYNDYRKSIVNINWNVFYNQYRLNPWQISQINRLNNLYGNFSSWNNYYRYNPDRWYYDRFYALERILGNALFTIFQNSYYGGVRPIVYFQNYRRDYYVPRYRVMPQYRNININVYRVDRNRFRPHDNPSIRIVRSARENNGFRNNGNAAPGGFRNNNIENPRSNNSGVRPNNGVRPNTGVRPNNGNFGGRGNNQNPAPNNGGFRGNIGNGNGNGSPFGGVRGNNAGNTRPETPRNNGGGGRSEGGFRGNSGGNSAPRVQQSQQPRQHNESRGGGGFRNGFAKN